NWVKGGSDTPRMYEPLASRVGSREIKGVLWHQGEREAARGGTAASGYTTNLAAVIANFKADFTGSPKTVVVNLGELASGTATAANVDLVRAGQISQWDSNADCLSGPVTYDLDYSDDLHATTDAQLQAVADRMWLCLEEHYY